MDFWVCAFMEVTGQPWVSFFPHVWEALLAVLSMYHASQPRSFQKISCLPIGGLGLQPPAVNVGIYLGPKDLNSGLQPLPKSNLILKGFPLSSFLPFLFFFFWLADKQFFWEFKRKAPRARKWENSAATRKTQTGKKRRNGHLSQHEGQTCGKQAVTWLMHSTAGTALWTHRRESVPPWLEVREFELIFPLFQSCW